VKKKKFKKGEKIRTIGALVFYINAGRWIYLRGVPKHPSIVVSMTLRTVQKFLKDGLFLAEENTEEK
jgi:hypothetical protein